VRATQAKAAGLLAAQLRMTALLLAIWFVVTLSSVTLPRPGEHHPAGASSRFLHGCPGAPVIYVLIIWWYARYMNHLDREYGVNDRDAED
jgi:putative solute:sodium symporter small subunit